MGTVMGLAGGGMLAQGTTMDNTILGASQQQATLMGDVACAAACVSVVGYLYAGRHLRAWLPIFVYACLVTGSAAVLLMAAAMVLEGSSLWGGGKEGVVGWVVDGHYAWRVVYLAVGPGIVGHTGGT